ncbi:pilus assembly protein FimV [Paucimonas lemoignei]|uniref:Pilus assembly protein FimV n=1 Tax=Paucimonas lemoignei TaxID=29443 RepID=A0A4V2UJD1_PAULE|nr:FimV/HubP family polar landmark protein [Paucimonas lemoignei]TCS39620.1 pilus assembly protein FimV [Paucimonas lemoignei]
MPINMHSSNHSQLASFSRKTLSAAVLSAVLCSGAYAAGLGKLTVLSSLGQPLRAEIELTSVAKDEAGTIVARLASAEAYRQANVEMSPALFALRFAVENRGDRHFIRVTSNQPINEPFMALLIELGGTSNRLVREYTFLLDPADLRMGQSTQIAAAPGATGRNTAQSQAANAQAAPVPQPEAQQKSMPQQRQAAQAARPQKAARSEAAQESPASGETYQVKNGDTLAQIAGQVKPEGVSLDQMLVAMYRANSNAFAGNNMNRLRAGQILSVPDADAARSISKSEARGVIVAQAADFNAYRNKLAGQVAASAQPKASEASQSAGGKITTQVEEKPTAASESKDKLKLSKAGAAAKGAGGSGIAAGTEEQIAKEKALAEANARVKELEKNVGDLQKLLEIKNKDLAAQQKQLDAKAAAAAAPAAAPAAKEQPAKETVAKEPATAAPAASATSGTVAPAAGNADGNAAAGDAAKNTETAAAEKPAESAAEKPAEAPVVVAPEPVKPKAKPVAPPPPPPEPSFLEDLLGNSVVLGGLGAGLLAGLGALAFYRMRRRKQDKDQYDDSILADSSLKANSLFGSTGGQSVDTSNSVFNSSFQPAASQLDANEVDPVAEADVYIAYGRDAQAEEILKEALRTQPDRHAVRLKLLEIYSNRKDLRAFETLATELYSMTKGEGEEWPQAATMGAAIDPGNPLYAGAKPAEGLAGTAPQSLAADSADAELDDLLSTTDPQHQSTFGALDTLGANSAYFATTMAQDQTLGAAPEAPTEEEQTEPAAEANSANVLDFDLAGFNLQPPAAPVEEESSEASSADLDIGSLDFSLEQAPQVADVDADSPRTAMSVEAGSDDLAFLSAEVPSLPEEPAAPVSDSADSAASLNFDLSDISLDLNTGESNTEAKAVAADLDDMAAPTLDFSTADTKLDLTQSAPDFEQSDAGLDLSQDSFESNLITDTEDDSSPDSEMATKLDLAIAYQEIGDREGARELLDEVIKGGNADQSEKARSLLEAMA